MPSHLMGFEGTSVICTEHERILDWIRKCTQATYRKAQYLISIQMHSMCIEYLR